MDNRNMTHPEKTMVGSFFEGIFLAACGYCLGRQLIGLYYAMAQLKKLKRNTDNAYMNLVTSMEQDSIA